MWHACSSSPRGATGARRNTSSARSPMPRRAERPPRQWALQNLHKPLTLAELAEHPHMSLHTFARRFNEEVGMSPGRWLIQQRVDRARHLLESTDLAVDEIAFRVGFAGGTSLREHLHAAIGVTPLAYRRTFRGALAQNRRPNGAP